MASPSGTTYEIDPFGLYTLAQDLHVRHDALAQIQSLLNADLDGLLIGHGGDNWTPLQNIQNALTAMTVSADALAQKVVLYEALTATDGSQFKDLFGANASKIDFGLWQTAVKELDKKGFAPEKVLAGSDASIESYMNMLSMDMMIHANDDQLEKLLGDNFKKFDLHAWHNLQDRIERSGMSTGKYVQQFHGSFSALFASHDWKRAFADAHNSKRFSPWHASTWDDQLHSFDSWTVNHAPSQIKGVIRVADAFKWGVVGGTVGLLKIPAMVGSLAWKNIQNLDLIVGDLEDAKFSKVVNDYVQGTVDNLATLTQVGKGLAQYAVQLTRVNPIDVAYQVRYENKPLEDVLVNKAGTAGSAVPQLILLLATDGGSAAFSESIAAGDGLGTALAKGIAAGGAEAAGNATRFLANPVEGLDALTQRLETQLNSMGQLGQVAAGKFLDQLWELAEIQDAAEFRNALGAKLRGLGTSGQAALAQLLVRFPNLAKSLGLDLNSDQPRLKFLVDDSRSLTPAEQEFLSHNWENAIVEPIAIGENGTFKITAPDGTAGIYKPASLEADLHRGSIPQGTYWIREIAAYRLDEVLKSNVVPPTIKVDGPFGVGSLQEWQSDAQPLLPASHYPIIEQQRIAAFDFISGNVDPNKGNYLTGPDGSIIGVDHGLSFTPNPNAEGGLPFPEVMGKALDPELLEQYRAVSPDEVVSTLQVAGLDPASIDLVELRLRTIQDLGMIPMSLVPDIRLLEYISGIGHLQFKLR